VATMVGKEKDAIKMIKDLVELDYDAIEAYEAAIARLDDAPIRARMSEFMEDHRRHVVELSQILIDLGETPPLQGDAKKILTKGKVVLAGLIGDRAILTAMKTNEDDTNTAYDRAAGRGDMPASAQGVIARGLADERKHRAYIETQLAAFEAGAARTSSSSII
jgi:uncharacterized protein (TIGR02284 family)